VILNGDRFCGDCGVQAPTAIPAQDGWRPKQWPDTGDDASVPSDEGPFFSHARARPSGPLSNATRYLCAAAYLDNGFANRVILHLLATRRAVAPSINFNVGPVLRHCLRARKNILIRDIALTVIVLAGLLIKTLPTLDFLLFTLILGVLLPRTGRGHSGLGKLASSVGVMVGMAVAFVLTAYLTLHTFASSIMSSGSLASGATSVLGLAGAFVLLLAATLATEFAYMYSTFKTLSEHLKLGTPPPGATSGAAEERVAMVEGAQWGNITLNSGPFPFVGAGLQTEAHWSIAIKLDPADPARHVLGTRSLDNEYVRIDPVELHQRIRERLNSLNDPGLPENERIARLTVSDRLVGSGLLRWVSPLIDKRSKTPFSHASREAIEALIRHPQAGLRYYQQVSVNDEGPAVMSRGRQVLEGVDQGVVVSAFVYAAVEGRMFYLQFVLTALPPIIDDYQVIDFQEGTSSADFYVRTLMYSVKHLFGAILSAPAGIYSAFRLRRTEQKVKREALSSDKSVAKQFGTIVSVREMGTSLTLGSYIQELDVEKYHKIISRLLLETVQDFLSSSGVDISAFESSANNIINGDVISIAENSGKIGDVGSRRSVHNPSAGPSHRSGPK
jgi:hypothetical protein